MDPLFKTFIGMNKEFATRKEIQSAFIQTAIDQGFVNTATHKYEINKVTLLRERIP